MTFVSSFAWKIIISCIWGLFIYFIVKICFSGFIKSQRITLGVFVTALVVITGLFGFVIPEDLIKRQCLLLCEIFVFLIILLNSCFYVRADHVGVKYNKQTFGLRSYATGFWLSLPFNDNITEERVGLHTKREIIKFHIDNKVFYAEFLLKWEIVPEKLHEIYQLFGLNYIDAHFFPQIAEYCTELLKKQPIEAFMNIQKTSETEKKLNDYIRTMFPNDLFRSVSISDFSVKFY